MCSYVFPMSFCKTETILTKPRLPQVFCAEEAALVQVAALWMHSCRAQEQLLSTALCLGCLSRVGGECKARSSPACPGSCLLFKAAPCVNLQMKLREFLHFFLTVLLQALDHSWDVISRCVVIHSWNSLAWKGL